MDTKLLLIAFGLLIGLIAFATIFFLKPKILKIRSSYILVGLSNSGKTSFFTLLRSGQVLPTHTSLQLNEAMVMPIEEDGNPSLEKPIHLVDVPGLDKLRIPAFNKVVNDAKAIIIIIDGFTASKNIVQVAELVYDVLVHPEVMKNQLPILIIANKTDLATSINVKRLKGLLESEITKLRVTRTSQTMDQLGESEEAAQDKAIQEYLGYESKPFQFEDLDPQEVTFLPLSLISNSKQSESSTVHFGQLREVIDWLAKN